jgi:C-terminal processing protease CtpA/Prc
VSAASYFALMVKNAGRGKIVGEETTGGAYSGNGFTTLKYILPNSKISVNFPYAHMIYSFKEKKNTGHGLLPDYHIPDSYESFKENEDRQVTFILDSLIQNKKK